jgi:phosphatidylserine/phosphatidylglycerophosphate/cardiolipin synthase-like enzyme
VPERKRSKSNDAEVASGGCAGGDRHGGAGDFFATFVGSRIHVIVAPPRSTLAARPEPRAAEVRLVADGDHYHAVVADMLPSARVAAWIATANLKELRVEAPIGTRARARGRFVSVLETFAELIGRGVDVRILHGRPASRAFRGALSRWPRLREKLELRECPRVHLKVVAVDGRALYLGSANFTGAGIGARSDKRRNFELGIVTDDEVLLDQVQERFDRIWSGAECAGCGLRGDCPRPIDVHYGARADETTRVRRR